IADLYKLRWQIELFFRLLKQTLRITHFIGRSENAVRIQIAVALIAFLLLHILQKMTQANHGFLELVRLVRANLMHRKDMTRLRQTKRPPPIASRQLALDWSYTSTGQPWDKPGHDAERSIKHCSHAGVLVYALSSMNLPMPDFTPYLASSSR